VTFLTFPREEREKKKRKRRPFHIVHEGPAREIKARPNVLTGTSASERKPEGAVADHAIAATATISNEMPTYLAACIMSGS
jgi:hypothetical protein